MFGVYILRGCRVRPSAPSIDYELIGLTEADWQKGDSQTLLFCTALWGFFDVPQYSDTLRHCTILTIVLIRIIL